MHKEPQKDLYLLAEPEKTKDIEPSPLARKAIAKAPPNLAIYDDRGELHPMVEHVLKLARNAKSTYEMQRQTVKDKWTKADEYYWMAQKQHRMPELTRAKVSASVFYRTVRRLADGAYMATFAEDMPMRFYPEVSVFDPSPQKEKVAAISEALNRWAEYCSRRTGLRDKMRKAYHWLYKYGNFVAYVPYDFQIERRKRYVPTDVNDTDVDDGGNVRYMHRDTGEKSDQPFALELKEEEYDAIIKDEVGFHPIPIENVYLDNRIEDLDRQTTFMWRSDMTRPEIYAQAQSGRFKNVNLISEMQKFQLFGMESDVTTQRVYDSGKTMADSLASEMYERWQVWLLLPKLKIKYNKKGEPTNLEWDQNAEECRYVLDIIGPIISGKPIIVNFSESPYWGTGVPFIGGHSHEDDTGFYHRGLQELLEDNIVQEQVAKGQLMDNRTLINFRPFIYEKGRVFTKDFKISHNTAWPAAHVNAVKQFDISDLTGNLQQTIQYLRDDSEKLANLPSFFMGQSMGGRTTASEFAAIRDQSSAPALYDIKSLNYQIIGGWMRKLKEYAPQFIDRDVALPDRNLLVTPDEFMADFRVKDVAVQDFENKSVVRQELINLTQIVFSNPQFAGFINPAGWLVKLCSMFKEIFPNPEEMLVKVPQVQQLLIEYQKQQQAVQKLIEQPAQLGQPGQEGQAQPIGAMGQAGTMPVMPQSTIQLPESRAISNITGSIRGA